MCHSLLTLQTYSLCASKSVSHVMYVYFFRMQIIKSKLGLAEFIMISFAAIHSLSLLASSFIEEEHQIAYFYSTTLVICLLVFSLTPNKWRISHSISNSDRYGLFAALFCMTVARKWNQTGDKWSHLSDIADWLNMYVLFIAYWEYGICFRKCFKI